MPHPSGANLADLSGRGAPWHDFTSCNAEHGREPCRPVEAMSKTPRSYESGPSPKSLVVIDDTPECDRALYFASRRSLRIGATVVMLRVIETHDRNQQWLGVADIMRAEAHEEAGTVLDRHAARSSSITG